MGMQCPPRPGPGTKGMKPNGLVDAAWMTSQTSSPIRSQSTFISLTRAMLTQRKMFSWSLASSATRVLDTGITLSTAAPYRAWATSRHPGVWPPTSLGMLRVP